MDMKTKILSTVAVTFLLGGCAATASTSQNMKLVTGPLASSSRSVTSVQTPYDRLLGCMSGAAHTANILNVKALPVVGVGAISDQTGKATHSDGGNGAYITQGAGDIVQSALMEANVTRVVNRRDPRVMSLEKKFGNENVNWTFTDYHITGSINSLDFLPGGGIDVNVAGIGGKYRQYRMIVGMDLFLTDTNTSEIIGSTSVTKQIVATDMGFGIGRFFGQTLVNINIGEQRREAVHVALRGMLKMATFDLLENLYGEGTFTSCREAIAGIEGVSDAGSQVRFLEAQAEQLAVKNVDEEVDVTYSP